MDGTLGFGHLLCTWKPGLCELSVQTPVYPSRREHQQENEGKEREARPLPVAPPRLAWPLTKALGPSRQPSPHSCLSPHPPTPAGVPSRCPLPGGTASLLQCPWQPTPLCITHSPNSPQIDKLSMPSVYVRTLVIRTTVSGGGHKPLSQCSHETTHHSRGTFLTQEAPSKQVAAVADTSMHVCELFSHCHLGNAMVGSTKLFLFSINDLTVFTKTTHAA